MMSKKKIKEWLSDSRDNLITLEQEGEGRDWKAYDEIRDEIDILKAVLNG